MSNRRILVFVNLLFQISCKTVEIKVTVESSASTSVARLGSSRRSSDVAHSSGMHACSCSLSDHVEGLLLPEHHSGNM